MQGTGLKIKEIGDAGCCLCHKPKFCGLRIGKQGVGQKGRLTF